MSDLSIDNQSAEESAAITHLLQSLESPSCIATATEQEEEEESSQRHSISRVVIRYENQLQAFSDTGNDNMNAFFDNDSFWSGSLTWY